MINRRSNHSYNFPTLLLKRVLIFLLMICTISNGKLIDADLSDLVQSSDFIAYGHSSEHEAPTSSPSTVDFLPLTIFRGKEVKHRKTIALCNSPNDSEAYDLAKIKGNYFVFASNEGRCYRPVRGIMSVVIIENSRARTSAIANQPEYQSLAAFIEKIQGALRASIKK